MNQLPRIPSLETRKREVNQLRECTRQLDLFIISLDELIAMVEVDLRYQQRERLESKSKSL
jgi:hypothetical protein